MKPMLAATLNQDTPSFYPCWATPKLDGIRCLIYNGFAVSRSLKAIPNLHIQEKLGNLPEGLDGELVLNNSNSFKDVTSDIMSVKGTPDFRYVIFDFYNDKECSYLDRIDHLKRLSSLPDYCSILEPVRIDNVSQFNKFRKLMESKGAEGVIIRNNGIYKYGRSTVDEGYLLKIKSFKDSEARILELVAQEKNNNPSEIDNLGHTKRSSKKEGKVSMNTLGALVVQDIHSGVKFKIGTGFTQKDRDEIWEYRLNLLGKIVKYKYQPHGTSDKPRFPVFLGFRDERDL